MKYKILNILANNLVPFKDEVTGEAHIDGMLGAVDELEKLFNNAFGNVTRLEIINHKDRDKIGRQFVYWDEKAKIELSLQDDNRTLKIFIDER